jgi:hypothetical protein
MPDISGHVDPIAAAIFEQYERRAGSEKQRTYLGASVIGRPCARALWYAFRWADKEKFDGRTMRLFQTGHMAESRFTADLRSIGAKVHDLDPASGKQFGFESLGGHMKGHMDGAATNIPGGGQKWHVLEFKTHSAKSFADLKAKGVKKAKPEHWVQMNWYMGKSGMDRALYLAVNKDNDDLYSERVEFDQVEFERTEARAESIIFGKTIPARISDDPKYYLCGWCPFNAVCHSGKGFKKSCRSCVHSTPERDGNARWSCAFYKERDIPVDVQRTGCDARLPLPFLVTYAEAIDAGDQWILFKRKDNGDEFVVTAEGVMPPADLPATMPMYRSAEIAAAADHRVICNKEVEAFREKFGAKVVG